MLSALVVEQFDFLVCFMFYLEAYFLFLSKKERRGPSIKEQVYSLISL